MSAPSRRTALSAGLAVGAGLALTHSSPSTLQAQAKPAVRYRNLGSTGFKVSEISLGAMNTRDAELIRACITAGLNYIDTANSYMNGVNEETIGQVMKTERDKVFLTTKLKASDPSQVQPMLETSLKRLQTDHVDCLLVHGVQSRNDVFREDMLKAYQDVKKKGLTKFIGLSTHTNQSIVLDAMAESKAWDLVLVGYSFTSPQDLKDAIARARKAGIAITVMKALARGQKYTGSDMGSLTSNQAALKWVLNDPNIDTIVPGMQSFEHLTEDLALMGMKLSTTERRELEHRASELAGSYCSGVAGCTGCQGQCPKGVALNEINRCVGYADGYRDMALARENYAALPREKSLAMCADCTECTVKCVNGIKTTEAIRRAQELFVA